MILSYYFIQEYVTLILCISYCIQYDIKKYEFFIEKGQVYPYFLEGEAENASALSREQNYDKRQLLNRKLYQVRWIFFTGTFLHKEHCIS